MLFAICSTWNFAQTSISWSFGHFVLYIISPEDFNAATLVGPSLILMQACFNRVQWTCHEHKKAFVRGHTSLCYMQWWSELVLFIFPQTTNNKCVYFHIAINSFFFPSSYLSLPLHHPQWRHLDANCFGTPTSYCLMHPSKG